VADSGIEDKQKTLPQTFILRIFSQPMTFDQAGISMMVAQTTSIAKAD